MDKIVIEEILFGTRDEHAVFKYNSILIFIWLLILIMAKIKKMQ